MIPVHGVRHGSGTATGRKQHQYRPSPSKRGYGGPEWEARRIRVAMRDGWLCRECGQIVGIRSRDYHCDHVIPKSKGGPDTDENCQTLCDVCHGRKCRAEQCG